jgi:putative ABC transport system substrate-binding protein
LTLHIVEAADSHQVAVALTEIDAEKPDALLINGGLAHKVRPNVMQFAVKKQLPTIVDSAWEHQVEPYHPLLGYAPRYSDLTRRAVYFVDKILQGAKLGDLPIQQPAKFELAVNLKTAKAIGLTVPSSLLARADEVTE